MKKFVPVVIAVVFVLSVVYVSYFGMKTHYEDFTVKAKNITITNSAFANVLYQGEILISDVTIANRKMKGIDVVYLPTTDDEISENGIYDADKKINIINENKINLAFQIEPSNTTSRTVTFTTTKNYALKDDSSENLTEADLKYDIVYQQTYNTIVMWLVRNVGGFTAKISMNDSGDISYELYIGVWDVDEERGFLPAFWWDIIHGKEG
jgi:hypothetical protein